MEKTLVFINEIFPSNFWKEVKVYMQTIFSPTADISIFKSRS